jgi:GAF domain-containing protein
VSVSAFADPSDSNDFVVPPEVPQDTQSMIVVPISIADQMIGVLTASDNKVKFFGQSDALLLETLASNNATAIERDTRLELGPQRRRRHTHREHPLHKLTGHQGIRASFTPRGGVAARAENRSRIRSVRASGHAYKQPNLGV